jgi:hypothetical protein
MVFFRLLHGIGFAMFLTTSITMASGSSSVDPRRMTTFALVLSIGLVVGPGLSTLLLGAVGMRTTLVISGIIVFPSVILAQSLREIQPKQPNREQSEFGARHQLGKVLVDRRVVAATLAHLSFSLLFTSFLSLGPLRLREFFRVSETEVATLFVYLFVLSFVSRMALRWVVPAGSERKLTVLALVLSSAGMIGMTTASSLTLFSIWFVFLGVSHGLMFPTTVIGAMRSSQLGERMLITAFHSTALDLGGVVGPFSFSLLASSTSIPTAMLMSATVPLVGVMVFWLLPNRISGSPVQAEEL